MLQTAEQYLYQFDKETPIAISTDKLNVFYDDQHAMIDASLAFKQNTITALIGPLVPANLRIYGL